MRIESNSDSENRCLHPAFGSMALEVSEFIFAINYFNNRRLQRESINRYIYIFIDYFPVFRLYVREVFKLAIQYIWTDNSGSDRS